MVTRGIVQILFKYFSNTFQILFITFSPFSLLYYTVGSLVYYTSTLCIVSLLLYYESYNCQGCCCVCVMCIVQDLTAGPLGCAEYLDHYSGALDYIHPLLYYTIQSACKLLTAHLHSLAVAALYISSSLHGF